MPATPQLTGFAALMTVRGGASQGQQKLQVSSQENPLSVGNNGGFSSVLAQQQGLSEGLSRQLQQWLAGASTIAPGGEPTPVSGAASGSSLPLTDLELPPEMLQAALSALQKAAEQGESLPVAAAQSEELAAFLQELTEAAQQAATVSTAAPAQSSPGLTFSHHPPAFDNGGQPVTPALATATAAGRQVAPAESPPLAVSADQMVAQPAGAGNREAVAQGGGQNPGLAAAREGFAVMLQEQQVRNGQAQQVVADSAATSRHALDTLSAITPSSAHSTVATSASAAQAATNTPGAAPAALGPPLPMAQPNWDSALVERVMWMSSQQLSRADIAVDPPELGPLQVRVNSQGEQASVVFTAQHAATRDALDQALPRLRDMLNSQGIDLVDVDVSDRQPDPGTDQQPGQTGGQGAAGEEAGLAEPTVLAGSGETAVAVPAGLVDAYA